MEYFRAITIKPQEAGCMDSSAANYNPNAKIDAGMCFEGSFEQCVEDHLFSVSLRECSDEHMKRALKIYALYDGYKQAIKEKNQLKIDTYTQQLADMCNAEYCETC